MAGGIVMGAAGLFSGMAANPAHGFPSGIMMGVGGGLFVLGAALQTLE